MPAASATKRTFRRVRFTTAKGRNAVVYFRPGKKVFHAVLSGPRYTPRSYEASSVAKLAVLVSGITGPLTRSLNALMTSPFLKVIPRGEGKLAGYDVSNRAGNALGFFKLASPPSESARTQALAAARRSGGTVTPRYQGAAITR